MPSDKRQRQRENTRARQIAIAAAEHRSRRRRQIGIAVVLVLAIGGAVAYASSRGDEDTKLSTKSTTTTSSGTPTTRAALAGDPDTCPPAKGTSKRFTTFPTAPKMCIDAAKTYTAAVKTDVGSFTLTLDAKQSPKTVNNFVFLARNHFYDGVTFHRVITDFVVQGGDPLGTGSGGPGYQFEDEIPAGYKYSEAEIAMANSGPNSNGSQFFITVSQNGADTLLSAVGGVPKYSPFGKVTDGMSVIKKIEADGSAAGTPTVVHKMISVKITEE